MSHSSRTPSSIPDPECERSSATSERHFGEESQLSPRHAREKDRVTLWGALTSLYEVPARWVRAYLSDAEDGPPWNGDDREFLCGPFSTDVHSPDA